MASNSGRNNTGPSSSNSSRGTKSLLCKYYANNACRKGNRCPFAHDRTVKADTVCRFYLQGCCTYGNSCRYDHKRPQYSEASASSRSSGSQSKEKAFGGAKLPEDAAAKCSVVPEHKLSASAAEFIPSWMKAPQVEQTYANASGSTPVLPLCPYFEAGNCEKGDECEFVHGMVCDMCNYACLHPADSEQRAQHKRECMAAHEAAMEEAFAEARSADKVCGICMESIRERDARFGILEGCRHCFCLECIRKWRRNQSEDFEKETVRSCPECRTHSDFVIPAKYWVEDANDKKKLIDDFRANAKQKRCKYMKKGNVDDCPFGNKCFYKHQLPDGTVVEGKSPRQLRRNAAPRRRRRANVFDLLSHDYATALLLSSDSDSDDELSIIFNNVLSQAFGLFQ